MKQMHLSFHVLESSPDDKNVMENLALFDFLAFFCYYSFSFASLFAHVILMDRGLRDLMDFEEGDGPSCRQRGSEDYADEKCRKIFL